MFGNPSESHGIPEAAPGLQSRFVCSSAVEKIAMHRASGDDKHKWRLWLIIIIKYKFLLIIVATRSMCFANDFVRFSSFVLVCRCGFSR